MLNVINILVMNNFKTFKNFQGPWKIFKDNKLFFKDQGHNQF